MAVPTFTVVCTKKRVIARDVYEIAMTKPADFTFKPGQFVLFDVPLVDNPADVQTRAFSIASTPSESELLFAIKLVPGGRASRWVKEMVEEGSEIVIKGPFGNFLLDPAPDRSLLFIATGTGIAPFRAQIVDALQRGDTRRMDVIFGVRSEEDVFWVEEMESLAQKYPNLFLHVTLSAPAGEWTGHRGRVQALAGQVVKEFANTLVYACGNPDMTKDIKNLAMTEWGLDRKAVHIEGYI